jgi:hypothetical protein
LATIKKTLSKKTLSATGPQKALDFGPRFRPPIVVAVLNISTAEISSKKVIKN